MDIIQIVDYYNTVLDDLCFCVHMGIQIIIAVDLARSSKLFAGPFITLYLTRYV